MPDKEAQHEMPFAIRAADDLAYEVHALVQSGALDARCKAADAVLEYALIRFGSSNPINDLVKHVEEKNNRSVS